ncbi:uncharacterized protein N7496_009120 [Penicillium cataractarum]|uniref:CCHC-type domain-containing protein n=1 Tax=Penicillium cataractarum TaxID=2100454 RepID=A0A9W9S122_9EURO|nr:uncharacterized protein N7496_009120 [Penicillium cataractarum]KAJ5369360.1 hypothetical protein N7496_009120 [Penicillium cataractarum]
MLRASKGVGPVPSGASGGPLKNSPTNRERVLNANHTAHDLLKELGRGQNAAKPAPKVVNFLRQVEDLTKDLLSTPLTDWQQELEALRRDLKQEIQAVKAAVEPPVRQTVRSFADMVRTMPAPAHYLSSSSSSSSPTRPSEVARDREVVVCLGDRSQVSVFRRLTSAELTKRANQARAKAARTTGTPALASVKIIASRQLKSGDLRFTVCDAKEAEIMRIHRDKWPKGLCKTAYVHMPTWGIVVHDVNVRSLGINKASEDLTGVQDKVIKDLLASNVQNWGEGAEITKISWLRIPSGKSGSLIVEFTSPVPANVAIDKGVLWDCDSLIAVLYDRAARVRQCFNCQQYGHIGTTCANAVKCVYCAEGHQSRDCPSKDTRENKCANCEGTHAAWSTECEARQREVEKIAELSRYRGRYHHIPAPYSINQPPATLHSSSASSWGTPRDSSSEELTSGVESSGLTPAARPSNGGKGTGPTTASRTGTGLQASQHTTNTTDQSVTTASSGRKRGRPRKTQKEKGASRSMDTNEDVTEPTSGQTQEQSIIIDQPTTSEEQPTFHFSAAPSTFQFSAGSSFAPRQLDNIEFRPEGPSSQATTGSSAQSKADKARARTAKAREARARKIAERKSSSNDTTNKSLCVISLAETASQERIESELSSELDEVNMRDLERQLESHKGDRDYQPSSPPAQEGRRKRKQPHSEDLSLNIRSAGRRRMHSRKSSRSNRQ